MKVGTRSLLTGAHQVVLHPVLLAVAWWREYGFAPVRWRWGGGGDAPQYHTVRLWNPLLWLAFVVHDLGYFGCGDVEGEEAQEHPVLGARIMGALFGEPWRMLCLLHSRYYAARAGLPVSPLCHADKRVILLEPAWLYLPRVRASGELREYMEVARRRAAAPSAEPFTAAERAALLSGDPVRWHRAVQSYTARWIETHRGGRRDTWTRAEAPHQAA